MTAGGDGSVRSVDSPEAVDALAAAVSDRQRERPIVALTSRQGETWAAFDVAVVDEIVGGMADLVFIVNGPLTRQLSGVLPRPQLGVFGGAARIWWPGCDGESDPYDHPLVQDRHGVYGTHAERAFEKAWRKGPATAPEAVDDALYVLLKRQHEALQASFDRQREDLRAVQDQARALRERLAAEQQRSRDRRSDAPARPSAEDVEGVDGQLAFMIDVLTAWNEQFPPGRSDRASYPLRGYRLLRGFMDDVAALQPPDRAKLPESVAMVVCGRAREINGMRLHELRSGEGGSDPPRVRSRDGAKAWRAAVRRNTPDAVQLHYWTCADGTIELASVRGHKYIDIPES